MPFLKTILVVDDNRVNRVILSTILSKQYAVLEAENGQIALQILREHHEEIAAVMLDLVMPILDGYAVLEAIQKSDKYSNMPILVTTDNSSHINERKALALGAWDFVSKPYDAQIITFRLKNAIDRSQLSALKELQYLSEYDALTGIYNKTKFFNMTREMIDASHGESFVFFRFDVDRFQLINSFFGSVEGDRLLIYIATHLKNDLKQYAKATYGRMESDVFCYCIPYDEAMVKNLIRRTKETLARYNPNYDIVPSIGIYVTDDASISAEERYNRATLAAKTCKGNYVDFYAYYNESMRAALITEQEITNEMNFALENKQFQIYLQPKYNIHTNLPCGAEALVRWMHPKKGMISPGEFIPIFERNGFITKLDYYVWEQACQCLHTWKTQGIKPYPISVNVSRVNIYNPNLVETLLALVEQYQLEPALLNLELTESAYTDNPTAMKKAMCQLQAHGFTIMMDDFGSGYSSLSLLKDIAIDILKIDMQFLSQTGIPGRGENIIASVIRMAKWLNIPVIAEGAETAEQVAFLRSVGCDYVQGYYYARPMPIVEYEQLCIHPTTGMQMIADKEHDSYHYDDLFSFNPEMQLLFNNTLQAAAIYEFADDRVEMIRVNEAYYALLGHNNMLSKASDVLDLVDDAHRAAVLNAFHSCAGTQKDVECEYMRRRIRETPLWLHAKLRYASTVGNKHIIIGELTDITVRKELDCELQKYKASWISSNKETHTVLIVDDAEINRTILKKILQDQFLFLEAENGAVAIRILQDHPGEVDLILLDISMPVMSGEEFLRYKKDSPKLDGIPVIVISADSSSAQQSLAFSLGAEDYIVKPFIPQVVTRRVKNVLESSHRFKEMVREYNNMSDRVKTDRMTELVNRVSAEELIAQYLERAKSTCAMMMIDIDDFKKINDTYGHSYGDKVICAVAEQLRLHFRKDDIVARMGGDEFSVFVQNSPDVKFLEKKAQQLCRKISALKINGENADITCSVGIATSGKIVRSFKQLYQNADNALYSAKCNGKNMVAVYGEETIETSIVKWVNDAESIVDTMSDGIYACDTDSYELIYANDFICKFAGITQEACKGKKCYEVLMHKTAPCEFCSLPKMVLGKVYTRLFQMPGTSHTFLLRGKTVQRNDKIIHLEVAVDFADVDTTKLHFKEGADYEQK